MNIVKKYFEIANQAGGAFILMFCVLALAARMFIGVSTMTTSSTPDLSSIWIDMLILFSGSMVILLLHLFVAKKYMTYFAHGFSVISGMKSVLYKIVQMPDGTVRKLRGGDICWGKGNEYLIQITRRWDEQLRTKKDNRYCLEVEKIFYIIYRSKLICIPFILRLTLINDFPAQLFLQWIEVVKDHPDSGNFFIKVKSTYTNEERFNFNKFLIAELDSNIDEGKRAREKMLEGFFDRVEFKDKELFDAIGSTLSFKPISGVEKIEIDYEKTKVSKGIGIVHIWDKEDVLRLQAL